MALAVQLDVENIILQTFDNQPEAVITDLLGRASAVVESYCHRSFELQTGIVETHDGPGGSLFRLRKYPVDNVTTPVAITEDGEALVNGTDFFVYDDGRVVRGDGSLTVWWTGRRQSIDVTYDAGFVTIPRDLAHVTASIVARWFQAGQAYAAAPASAGAVKRISLNGSDEIEYADAVSDVTGTSNLTEAEMTDLRAYRKTVFA